MMSFVIGNLLGVSGVNVHLNLILEEVPEIINTTGDIIEEDKVTGELALENVTFAYPEKPDVTALKNVSFSVDNDKKRVIALVGASGCGKSSCVAML
jgi:ATP-binding cassette, subfamily B (MDR/TAP), member 1